MIRVAIIRWKPKVNVGHRLDCLSTLRDLGAVTLIARDVTDDIWTVGWSPSSIPAPNHEGTRTYQ